MALTADELTRIRRKIGDTGATQVFSDAEIQDTFDEQGNMLKTVVALIDELLISAARMTDYTQNATSEKRSQVFEQLKQVRAVHQARIDAEDAYAKVQSQVIVARPVLPKRAKDAPDA